MATFIYPEGQRIYTSPWRSEGYSIRRFFMGLAVEAFHTWEKMIRKLRAVRIEMLNSSTHGVMLTLEAKNCSHILLTI